MVKIYTYVDGHTFNTHEKIVRKLTKRGAEVVESPAEDAKSIVFCPIVSRFESDVSSALCSAKEKGCKEVILVVMHHTFNADYSVSHHMDLKKLGVEFHVQCLFYEKKGFLKCKRNKDAIKQLRKQLGLKKKKFLPPKGSKK